MKDVANRLCYDQCKSKEIENVHDEDEDENSSLNLDDEQ